MRRSSPFRRRFRIGLVTFWTLVVAWMAFNLQARGVPDATLESGAAVTVTRTSDAVEFTPVPDTARVGLVLYPGSLVDPVAYAPLARDIAEAGYRAVILPLAFRQAPTADHQLALFERTLAVRNGAPGRAWIVGGHSRGGALAARFARDHEGSLDGLLLIGTSHPREDDLSGLAIDVTKVFGSEDGLVSEEEVRQFAPLLPRATHWERIEGGNHAQFGWYGWQLGSGTATISREAQHAATVGAVRRQLDRVARATAP